MSINHQIEHTLLAPGVPIAAIEKICTEARQHHFAAVCIPPLFVKNATSYLQNSAVKIATVIGYPYGYAAIEAKVAELVLAILDGAQELNVAINTTALKNNDWQYLAREINTIMPIIKNKGCTIKIIVETSILAKEEIIQCCDLYGAAGVDYVQTATSIAYREDDIETVGLLRSCLSDNIQIKTSGAIKNNTFARLLLAAGATRLGCTNSIEIIQPTTSIQ
jgi:deoxyribose-phosphate aldolase